MSKLFADLMDKQPPTTQSTGAGTQVKPPSTGERNKPAETIPPQEPKSKVTNDIKMPRNRDTTTPQDRGTMIEIIRKAVRQIGKEAATYRFTQEEKRALTDIVYTYKSRGIKTSENEITRTAIHSLVEDYHENGESSILARVLERLNE